MSALACERCGLVTEFLGRFNQATAACRDCGEVTVHLCPTCHGTAVVGRQDVPGDPQTAVTADCPECSA